MEEAQPVPVHHLQNADFSDPLLTTAKCNRCRKPIPPGEYRVVIGAAEFGAVPRAIDSSTTGGRRRFLVFCAKCAFGVIQRTDEEGESFFANPIVKILFGPTRKQITQGIECEEWLLRECAKESRLADAERQAREGELATAVRRLDIQGIDALLPEVRGREASLDEMAAKHARRKNYGLPRSQQIDHNEAVEVVIGNAVAKLGDGGMGRRTTTSNDGPKLMAEYLKDTAKARTLKPFQRKVAELYARGKNQTEIARVLRISQPSVCRAIQALKVIIHVAV